MPLSPLAAAAAALQPPRAVSPDTLADISVELPVSPPRISATMDDDPLRATCRLHNPRSLYTRNSSGYYGSYAPPCNGCNAGKTDAHEYELAENVRNLHGQLLTAWTTDYKMSATADAATGIMIRLVEAIELLNATSGTITDPQTYAERAIQAHIAAVQLDSTVVECAAGSGSLSELLVNTDRLLRCSVVDVEHWPIVEAAIEVGAAMEDRDSDDAN